MAFTKNSSGHNEKLLYLSNIITDLSNITMLRVKKRKSLGSPIKWLSFSSKRFDIIKQLFGFGLYNILHKGGDVRHGKSQYRLRICLHKTY